MKTKLIIAVLALWCSVAHAQTPGQRNNNYSFMYSQDTLSSSSTTGYQSNLFSSIEPFKWWSLAVAPKTGSGAWSVALQGSLDGVLWSNMVINSSVTYTAGALAVNSAPIPALYVRTNVISLAGGLSVTATAIGVW